jgi:hypothetical protein
MLSWRIVGSRLNLLVGKLMIDRVLCKCCSVATAAEA